MEKILALKPSIHHVNMSQSLEDLSMATQNHFISSNGLLVGQDAVDTNIDVLILNFQYSCLVCLHP
jgi:hypothetical protein